MDYRAGTHIIATLQTTHIGLLQTYERFQELADHIIATHALQNLGAVYHNFTPGGFTAVICLSESHLSIHTWPEHGLVNLDIYLSNFERTNDGTVQAIFEQLVAFFAAEIVSQTTLKR